MVEGQVQGVAALEEWAFGEMEQSQRLMRSMRAHLRGRRTDKTSLRQCDILNGDGGDSL
jgi:hypothetical protein